MYDASGIPNISAEPVGLEQLGDMTSRPHGPSGGGRLPVSELNLRPLAEFARLEVRSIWASWREILSVLGKRSRERPLRFHTIQRGEIGYFFLVHGDNQQTGWLSASEARFAVSVLSMGALRKVRLIIVDEDGNASCAVDAAFEGLVRLSLILAHRTIYWRARVAARRDRMLSLDKPAVSSASTSLTDLRKHVASLDTIDFDYWQWALKTGKAQAPSQLPPPFDKPELLPTLLPATPAKKSAVFLHNSYYHFNMLASGLRRRGWDVLTVSIESPESPSRQFYHGEDLNLYHADPTIMRRSISAFFQTVPEKFGALHFYGMGIASFFPENASLTSDAVAWDFLELKRHRTIIGYMPSGCLDGARQSSIRTISGACRRCVWELRPDVCNEARSAAWTRDVEFLCDWVGLECDWAVDERTGPKYVQGPVVTALDRTVWSPDLVPPEDMAVNRCGGEILVYHAVGNYEARRAQGRDIKGTGAVMAAVERLREEGVRVRLIFATKVPSSRVRFLQVQADIVVDQLNYGRYGANARESLMLGKPVICRLDPQQGGGLPPLRPIAEAPIVSADESRIYAEMRKLVEDRELRLELGKRSRQFALKWHDSDVCAERYERVINRLRDGLVPETPELYPPA